MRYLGWDGTVFVGWLGRGGRDGIFLKSFACTVLSWPIYLIKTAPSWPRYLIKTAPSRPRYLINFTLYCCFRLIQGFFKITKQLFVTQLEPSFDPKNLPTIPLMQHSDRLTRFKFQMWIIFHIFFVSSPFNYIELDLENHLRREVYRVLQRVTFIKT